MKGVTLRDCRVRFEGDDLSDFGEALRTERCTEVSVENFRGKAARPGLADQVME